MEESYHQCRVCNQRFDEYQELVIHCQIHVIHKVGDRVQTNNSVEVPQIKKESDSDVFCENSETGFCDNVCVKIESDWETDPYGGSCFQKHRLSGHCPVSQNSETTHVVNPSQTTITRNLQNRRQPVSGNQVHKCDECNKSFRYKSLVSKHKQSHKEEKQLNHKLYTKTKNNATFSNNEVHNTGEKSFKCDVCDKTFKNNRHLQTHLRNTNATSGSICGRKRNIHKRDYSKKYNGGSCIQEQKSSVDCPFSQNLETKTFHLQAALSKTSGNVLDKTMTVKSTLHSQEIIMSLEFSDDLSDGSSEESPETTGMFPVESSVNVENLVMPDNYGKSEKCIEETTEILTSRKCTNDNLNTQWNEAEDRLSEFVLIQSLSGHAINTAELQQEAIKIAHDLQIDEFSNGSMWCRKFMARKGFCCKDDFIVPQKSLVDCKVELVDVLKSEESRRLRQSYPASFKLQAVKFAEENGGNRAAGKKFGISEKNIRLWRKTKGILQALEPTLLKNRNYKARWVDLENQLAEYIKTKNTLSGGGLDINQLVCKAKKIAEKLRIEDFMGTQSWKKKFMQRKGFYVRVDKTIGLKLDADLNNKLPQNNNNVHVEDSNKLPQDNNNVHVEGSNKLPPDNNSVHVEGSNKLLQNGENTNLHFLDNKTPLENYLHKETVDVPFLPDGMPPETAVIFQLDSKSGKELVENRFVCDVCGKSFKYKASIKKHLITHQVEQYPCDICIKTYNTPMKLKYHRQNHFNKYLCDVCGQLLRSRKSLKYHRKNHLKMYECDHCSLCFSMSKQHADHIIRHVDDDTATYKCEFCFKSFKYYQNFTRHERKCYLTQKLDNNGSFQNYLELQSQSLKNICDVCGKTFISSVSLKIHKKTHRELETYKCNICVKTFKHANSLFKHMKIHHGENLFKCDVCGKTFAGKWGWIEHLNTHSVSQNDLQFEKPRKAYTAEFKLEVLKFAKNHGSTKAQAKYNVCEKSIRDWKKIKGTLLSTEKTKLEYRRSNTRWVKIEDRLSSELLQGCAIRRAELLHKAKAIAKELGFTNFYGNNSWCQRFMRRRELIYKNGLIVPKQFLDSKIEWIEIENGDSEEKVSGSNFRNAYTVAVKLQVVKYAEENGGNRAASRKYGISESCIRNWRQAKAVLQNSDQTKKANRGSSAKWIELESQLAEYVLTQNTAGCGPSILQVKDKAMEIAKTLQVDNFTCSSSWYHRFKQRKGLCYKNRRIQPKLPVLK